MMYKCDFTGADLCGGLKRGLKQARNETKSKICDASKEDHKSRHKEHINHGAKDALPQGNFNETESRVHGAVEPAHACARTDEISMCDGGVADWKGDTKGIRWGSEQSEKEGVRRNGRDCKLISSAYRIRERMHLRRQAREHGASRHSGVRWLNPVERLKGETEEREERGGPAPKTYVSKGSYWLGGYGARAWVGVKREVRTVKGPQACFLLS